VWTGPTASTAFRKSLEVCEAGIEIGDAAIVKPNQAADRIAPEIAFVGPGQTRVARR